MECRTGIFTANNRFSTFYFRRICLLAVLWFLGQGVFSPLAAENYALVLGTNYQGDSPISDLNSPEKDAALIRDRLSATGEFSASHVKVLLGDEVNRSRIKAEIDQFARVVTSKDQFFLFFSGHGAYYRDSGSGKSSRMLHFLVMYYRPHLSGEELSEWLKTIKGSSLVVIDACFSGGLAGSGQSVKGAANIPIPEGNDAVVLQDMKSLAMNGRIVIASSDADETSIEAGPPISQGVFTFHFARAMVDGDLNHDGVITAAEAFSHAKQNTVAMASRFKHRQTPQISGDGAGWFFKQGGGAAVAAVPQGSSTGQNEPGPGAELIGAPEETETSRPPQSGTIVIETNLRQDIIQNDPVQVIAVSDDLSTGDPFNWKIRWVSDPHWGKVARLSSKAPAGVYRIRIKARGYAAREFDIAILPGQSSKEEILAAPEGRGAISGNVWVENFTQPFGGLKIFLDPVRTSRQPVVITGKDGLFIFPDLLPGKYTIRIVGGIGYFTNPYNATIEVKDGEVADIEVILKETVKRGLPGKQK